MSAHRYARETSRNKSTPLPHAHRCAHHDCRAPLRPPARSRCVDAEGLVGAAPAEAGGVELRERRRPLRAAAVAVFCVDVPRRQCGSGVAGRHGRPRRQTPQSEPPKASAQKRRTASKRQGAGTTVPPPPHNETHASESWPPGNTVRRNCRLHSRDFRISTSREGNSKGHIGH